MFHAFFAVFLFTGFAAPSWSATCTANSTDPPVMTAQTTAGIWSGDDCGPTNTDDYVIPSGFEVTINTKGAQLHATGTAQSMYAAIDAMADKLDRQITRRKEKAADHHQVDGGIKTMKLES